MPVSNDEIDSINYPPELAAFFQRLNNGGIPSENAKPREGQLVNDQGVVVTQMPHEELPPAANIKKVAACLGLSLSIRDAVRMHKMYLNEGHPEDIIYEIGIQIDGRLYLIKSIAEFEAKLAGTFNWDTIPEDQSPALSDSIAQIG